MKVYFETSALGFYFDDRSPAERDAVRLLVHRASREGVEGFVSDLVLAEIEAAPEPTRTRLLRLATSPTFSLLPVTEGARELAEGYVTEGGLPQAFPADALHVAIAVLNRIDVIASYNLRHLVRHRTVAEANRINRGRRLGSIDIRRPGQIP